MKRGDIYYISRDYLENGTEERAGRPAVIVSCNDLNERGFIATVVYLTTSPRAESPYHIDVMCNGRPAKAICEQVTSVAASRIGGYAGRCTDDEMEAISAEIATILGLDSVFDRGDEDDYDEDEDEEEYDDENESDISARIELAQMQRERDIYKNLYDSLLEKVMR